MGGVNFRLTMSGFSVRQAFDTAVEEAIDEEGNNPYNGTISTTDYQGDLTEKFKKSGKSLNEFINEFLHLCNKRECYSICISSPEKDGGKTKTKVEHIVTPGTKKWVLKYVVYCFREDKNVGSYDTKGAAVDAARKYTEKTMFPTTIEMQKKLEKGTTEVARVTYKGKDKEGKWVFFGTASI